MKIAIAGYGVEGEASYRYWASQPDVELTIVDENQEPSRPLPPGAKTILGPDALDQLIDFDLIVRTPPLAPSRIKTNGKTWSATNEFFAKCPAPIIGITGTKGKGTTASLIHSILKAGDKTSHLIGNIGQPALDVLPDIKPTDVVVFELSSFQLWDLECSPHIAVVLAIEPDHLDVHKDFTDYVRAKNNIARHQTGQDMVVFNPSNDVANKIAEESAGRQIGYFIAPATRVINEWFVRGEQEICSTSSLKLPGKHNIENACAAIEAAWEYVQDTDKISQGLSSFKGLPHRLELVRELNGVAYYDDSFSASTVSTIVAVEAFVAPKIIILGGFDRHIDLSDMVKAILKNNLKKALLIGQTAPVLANLFEAEGAEAKIELMGTPSMEEIVKRADALAETGDVVLLSPGCPSFDMFTNFQQRGERFQVAVKKL